LALKHYFIFQTAGKMLFIKYSPGTGMRIAHWKELYVYAEKLRNPGTESTFIITTVPLYVLVNTSGS